MVQNFCERRFTTMALEGNGIMSVLKGWLAPILTTNENVVPLSRPPTGGPHSAPQHSRLPESPLMPAFRARIVTRDSNPTETLIYKSRHLKDMPISQLRRFLLDDFGLSLASDAHRSELIDALAHAVRNRQTQVQAPERNPSPAQEVVHLNISLYCFVLFSLSFRSEHSNDCAFFSFRTKELYEAVAAKDSSMASSLSKKHDRDNPEFDSPQPEGAS